MRNDTIKKTLLVAALLSVVCSVVVSSAAVIFRESQAKNKDLDRKKNILMAAGLLEEGKSIEELFAKFEARVVDLSTGDYRDDLDIATFDQRKAAKSAEEGIEIARSDDFGGIKRRSKSALVYLAIDANGELDQIILPIHGKGLWSTMYGFLALAGDLLTINGFAFYEHGETPGLGGEVDNPLWKGQWVGKKAFDEQGVRRITVLKGKVNPLSTNVAYQVDGLSGATITARGVDGMLRYWLGENGFEPLLKRLRKEREEHHGG